MKVSPNGSYFKGQVSVTKFDEPIIKDVEITFCLHNSNIEEPVDKSEDAWEKNLPNSAVEGQYVWQRTKIIYSKGTPEVRYACIQGSTGLTGKTGEGIIGQRRMYAASKGIIFYEPGTPEFEEDVLHQDKEWAFEEIVFFRNIWIEEEIVNTYEIIWEWWEIKVRNIDETEEWKRIINPYQISLMSAAEKSLSYRTEESDIKNLADWCKYYEKTLIDGGTIATNSIEANQLKVDRLSAIRAELGDVYAGSLSVSDSKSDILIWNKEKNQYVPLGSIFNK